MSSDSPPSSSLDSSNVDDAHETDFPTVFLVEDKKDGEDDGNDTDDEGKKKFGCLVSGTNYMTLTSFLSRMEDWQSGKMYIVGLSSVHISCVQRIIMVGNGVVIMV